MRWVSADASFPTFRSSNRRSRHQNVGNGLLDRDIPAQLGDVTGGLDVVLGHLDVAFSSTTNVDRMTPCTVLPYIVFSPKAPPHAVSTFLSGSESRGKVSPSWSRNLASFSGLSGEIPTTSRPASLSSARLSRKSQACLVQPGGGRGGGRSRR